MEAYEEDFQYETKMDRISEQIEELMLDAMFDGLVKSQKPFTPLW
jgi:hypothetical protein